MAGAGEVRHLGAAAREDRVPAGVTERRKNSQPSPSGLKRSTRPSSSIGHETRFANCAEASSAAPYASARLRSGSERSGKGKENFRAKAALSAGVSKLAPRMVTPSASKSRIRSRNPLPSIVQPGVSALGKNQSSTFLPRRSRRRSEEHTSELQSPDHL